MVRGCAPGNAVTVGFGASSVAFMVHGLEHFEI